MEQYIDIWNLVSHPGYGMVCSDYNVEMVRRDMQSDRLNCYFFGIVTKGWLEVVYNDRKIIFEKDDLFIYIPGIAYSCTDCSEDYHSICIMADEDFTFESPVVRDMVHAAYYPFLNLLDPHLHLDPVDAELLCSEMREIIRRQQTDHYYKSELKRLIYAIFLLDVRNIVEHTAVPVQKHNERSKELFLGFLRLLPKHFAEHHDIKFYAESLCITPVYLSRVIKQVSGRTVVDYINQMLLMEASWLLNSTHETTIQIADRLHFANQASFCRFFKRMKGVAPIAYRNQRRDRERQSYCV